MRKSIRLNFFVFLVIFMGTFMLVSVILNLLFLQKFYVIKNKDFLREQALEIQNLMMIDVNFQKEIEAIDRAEGISVAVADFDYTMIFTSYPIRGATSKLPNEIEKLIESSNKKEIYSVVEKSNETSKIVYVTQTKNGKFIILTKQMKGIEESAIISNQFNIIIGISMLILGSIFLIRLSSKITKPIITMSRIAESISNLKFDQKVAINNQDEIGILAKSINTLSDKLKMSLDRMQNDIEFQKTLSRNMAHELKTPIGVIKGYAEGLAYGVASSPEMHHQYIHTIVAECDRMDELVIEMLELSKLEAANYVLEDIEVFPFNKLIESIKSRFSVDFMDKNIRFLYEETSEVQLKANYALFERVISNLVSNAIKYNDENKYIRVYAKEKHNEIQINIFNTCNNIDAKEIQRIFDPFYKIDKARSRSNEGHGLGLSIVKSIVELHNGIISVESIKGGIEFKIDLPKNIS
ncbi:MAG: HAMP domain-containing histidine kinase [Clostridia bacterium]|nr:HAMP domain-containing histidine kinase [Clostridia bacterium]